MLAQILPITAEFYYVININTTAAACLSFTDIAIIQINIELCTCKRYYCSQAACMHAILWFEVE